MRLEKLSLVNFKNYEQLDLDFHPGINCFVGDNGEGKTNLLDAIYYLAFSKSFFNPIDSQNIRWDQDFFVIQGQYLREDKAENIYCAVKKGQKKKLKRNKKEYDRFADHIGLFPTVIITPSDSELVHGGSEVRRKLMDSIISQFDREYLNDLLCYNKALSQRNALLKYFQKNRTFQQDTLDAWNEQLIMHGERMYRMRNEFINEFTPYFNDYYTHISDDKESVSLEYKSHLNEATFRVALEESVDKDRVLGYTTVGLHKDDLIFKIGDHPIKKFGSQGQQKSFLIALKLGQFNFLKSAQSVSPILLLDDIFDKLDRNRITKLMTLVSDNTFGQVFITDTNSDRVIDILNSHSLEYQIHQISQGQLVE